MGRYIRSGYKGPKSEEVESLTESLEGRDLKSRKKKKAPAVKKRKGLPDRKERFESEKIAASKSDTDIIREKRKIKRNSLKYRRGLMASLVIFTVLVSIPFLKKGFESLTDTNNISKLFSRIRGKSGGQNAKEIPAGEGGLTGGSVPGEKKMFPPEDQDPSGIPSDKVHEPDGNPEAGQDRGDIDENSSASAIGKGEDRSVNLVFAGDVYFSDYVLNAYDRAGGIEGVLSEDYLDDLRNADYVIVNEEFPFSERGEAADKEYTFRVNPERVELLKDLGVDLVSLANNHSLDYGETALLDTLNVLNEAGIRHMGAGKNLSEAAECVNVSINGIRIAFLSASSVYPYSSWAAGESSAGVFSAYDMGSALSERVAEAKKEADFVICFLHWGEERSASWNEMQQNIAHTLASAGADLIIGAHPHVIQGAEYYEGVPIFYSLGNFIFGSQIAETFILKAELSKSAEKTLKLKLKAGTSSNGFTCSLPESRAKEVYSEIEWLSRNVSADDEGNVWEN